MPSQYGTSRRMICPGCGLKYDDMRTGMTFRQVRNDIISIGTDAKTGKTKYGRRNGTLGYWHEIKMMFWDQHVGECTDAAEAAKKQRRSA